MTARLFSIPIAVPTTFLRSLFALAAFAAAANAISFNAHAAGGDADPLFGGAGYVRYGAQRDVPGLFSAVLPLDDGSVIAAGSADTDVFVRRYLADGALDDRFGAAGTTIVPGLIGGGRSPAAVRLLRDAAGRILVEQNGTVRRLTPSGAVDTSYAPARLNVNGAYNLLPQPDGRFVVVTSQQSPTPTVRISVRFYNPDGSNDTVRGDMFGERLVYPGNEGTYTDNPLSAVNDATGRILIAALWKRNAGDTSLVLIRLSSDGSYDPSFGQGGVVLIGSQLGAVTSPQVRVGSDDRIAYLFGVPSLGGADPYFVVYVLDGSGRQDSTAVSGGRIGVVIPAAVGLNIGSLQLLSGPREIVVTAIASASTSSSPPAQLMLWRADASAATFGPPAYVPTGSIANDGASTGNPVAFGGRLWIPLNEDRYQYGRLGVTPLFGYGRGVLARYDTSAFATAPPLRIVSTFSRAQPEAFTEAKPLSDGSLLVLGTYQPHRLQYSAPTLTRFTADGRLDTSYGGGSGRVTFATGDGSTNRLVPTATDTAVVLRMVTQVIFSSCFQSATLWRITSSGTPDPTFGSGTTPDTIGAANVYSSGCAVDIEPGFVDAQGRINLIQMLFSTPRMLTPLRRLPSGAADPAFKPVAQQSIAVTAESQFGTSNPKLDALPDGRLQGILINGGDRQLTVQLFRWGVDGSVDPASPLPGIILPAVDSPSSAADFDSIVLPDGRTLIAIHEASQRIMLRVRSDGTLDPTFGVAGVARIDGVGLASAAKLAIAADGSILLAYNTRLATSVNALAVARLTPDGQPDRTFTTDGRFDSVFSLTGTEVVSDVVALPDGHIAVVGRSGGTIFQSASTQAGSHGLLLRLRGTATQPAVANVPVVEFFNAILDHYFVTAGSGEINAVDTGAAGPGWERTARGFRAFIPESGIPSGALPVCRFYGTPGRGPNSHFYTVIASECDTVKRDTGWTYEGIAFYAYAPVNGQCAAGQEPVYRVYNGRFAQNDSNHRYLTDVSEYARMQQAGWVPEGIALCGASPM